MSELPEKTDDKVLSETLPTHDSSDANTDMDANAVEREESIGQRTLVMACAIVALTVPATLFHGYLLHRWGDHQELVWKTQALSQLPQEFGQWRHVADGRPIVPHLQQQLELRGYLHRVYEHEATGQRVSLLVLVGPSGPLVRHPPEICYQARANRLLKSRPLTVMAGVRESNLRLLRYESNASFEADFFVAYAFGLRGTWRAPDSPRRAYAGEPVLYKLHVLTEASSEGTESVPQGMVEFLSELLPTLNETTMPADSNKGDAADDAAA